MIDPYRDLYETLISIRGEKKEMIGSGNGHKRPFISRHWFRIRPSNSRKPESGQPQYGFDPPSELL